VPLRGPASAKSVSKIVRTMRAFPSGKAESVVCPSRS
jgi:hypothetical protein